MDNRIKQFRDIYLGKSDVKRSSEPRSNLLKGWNDDILADLYNTF
jgi:hypothetical protein